MHNTRTRIIYVVKAFIPKCPASYECVSVQIKYCTTGTLQVTKNLTGKGK